MLHPCCIPGEARAHCMQPEISWEHLELCRACRPAANICNTLGKARRLSISVLSEVSCAAFNLVPSIVNVLVERCHAFFLVPDRDPLVLWLCLACSEIIALGTLRQLQEVNQVPHPQGCKGAGHACWNERHMVLRHIFLVTDDSHCLSFGGAALQQLTAVFSICGFIARDPAAGHMQSEALNAVQAAADELLPVAGR